MRPRYDARVVLRRIAKVRLAVGRTTVRGDAPRNTDPDAQAPD